MGPHVPRRRLSFARTESGVRFSKVPVLLGAHVPRSARMLCKQPGRIRFPSLPVKTDNAFCSAVEQAVESRWSRVRIPYALTESQ